MIEPDPNRLPVHAYDWAAREMARWLRAYAKAELSQVGGVKPSLVAESVAFICRNMATNFEASLGKLSADLAHAEQRVISAARDGRAREIREALALLDRAEHAIQLVRRTEAMRRLGAPE
jgi:hypothetical protein